MPSLPIDVMAADVFAAKQSARAYAREARRAIAPEIRASMDENIARHATSLPAFLKADVILGFYPLRGEPDVLPILRLALSLGKQLALPLCHTESSTMTFHLVSSLEDTEPGSFGIREPSADKPILTDFSNALCFVPALCFDRRGHRIGYGKGYYDRFLADYNGESVGVTYEELLFDRLPCEPTDKAIPMIITEGGIFLPDVTTK